MQVKFWGTRGSVPVPGDNTVRYGGNTSCVEVLSDAGTRVIIDCGTGLRALGQQLVNAKEKQLHGHVLLSHTHWDHIQGIPFFLPFFMQGYEWDVYGPKGLSRSIKDTLAGQMQYSYFPVGMGHFNAMINYHDLLEGVFHLHDIKVDACYLNHTALTCGFRLEVDGCAVVYYCDHEPYVTEAAYESTPLTGQDIEHAKFAQGADLLIHDAQYTAKEYPNRIGWGHSTAEYACKVAHYAGVKKVALTHHDPALSDAEIDAHLKSVRDYSSKDMPDLEVFAAIEGQVVYLQEKKVESPVAKSGITTSAINTSVVSVPRNQSVLIYAVDQNIAKLFVDGADANHISATVINSFEAIEEKVKSKKVALFVIEHNPPKQDAIELISLLREQLGNGLSHTPIVVVSANRDSMFKLFEGVHEHLTMPLSQAYVQTKMLAWLLRMTCRWQPAPFPDNEKARLLSLHNLRILGTKQEERFDRITRLATALFHVPVAMVSLVDSETQWVKSAQGLPVQETPRDQSFCAHAVYAGKTLIVNDTTLDDRFADHPSVLGEPHVRFYAGCPLILKDGYCVGTLCIADIRPRVFDENEVKLLGDLRDMVVEELIR